METRVKALHTTIEYSTSIYLNLSEYFRMETRVKALHTTIEYSGNETVSLFSSSLYKDQYVIASELGRYFMHYESLHPM